MIWNQRALDDAFMTGYERLLSSRAPEYSKTGRNHLSEDALARFFGRGYRTFKAKNAQTFDRQSLHGRLNSSSYAPKAGTVDHAALARDLDRLFDMHVNDGRVTFRYDTIVYLGELS